MQTSIVGGLIPEETDWGLVTDQIQTGNLQDQKWCHDVLESKFVLLAAQQANKLGDELLVQGIATLFGKPADWEDGELASKNHLAWFGSLVAFIEQSGEVEREAFKLKKPVNCCKCFLVPTILRRCVNFFFPVATHRWARSGYFLWAKKDISV